MLHHIISELERIQDSQRAPAMEAYMKNRFAFLGVTAGPRKNVFKPLKEEWSNLSTPKRLGFHL
jgi:3-methyladenine DNA glycosylase AlkD